MNDDRGFRREQEIEQTMVDALGYRLYHLRHSRVKEWGGDFANGILSMNS